MADFCDKLSYTMPIINSCNNELIYFNVESLFCISSSINPSGKIQYRFHQVLSAQGFGNLGNEYIFNNANTNIYNVIPGMTSEYTSANSINVISKGSIANFIIKVLYHYTITPNGDVQVENSHIISECRG